MPPSTLGVYNIHFSLNYHGRTIPRSVNLAVPDDEAAVKAFRAWCTEHPDGYQGDTYIQRPFLMKEQLLDRGE